MRIEMIGSFILPIKFFKPLLKKSEVHRDLPSDILSKIEEFEHGSNDGIVVSASAPVGGANRAAVGKPCQIMVNTQNNTRRNLKKEVKTI